MARELELQYWPPLDWPSLSGFLGVRSLKGVEYAQGDCYSRTVRFNGEPGWIRVANDVARSRLRIELHLIDESVEAHLTSRLRALFDLDTRPEQILAVLGSDTLIGDAVRGNPGLRVPGAFDGFELAVRAILGQQITVKAAATIGGRFSEAFGDPIQTDDPNLTHLTPTPERIAGTRIEEIASLGIIRARARSIIAVATEYAHGRLSLQPGADAAQTIARLLALPGIGPWTAQYIAMRALRLADSFPKEDIALRNRLGGVTPSLAEERSLAWRPFRSYATLHLWNMPVGAVR